MERLFIWGTEAEKVLQKSGVSDEQIQDMEQSIMAGGGDPIKGTGGLKKIRCGAEGRGKRGGVRIVFADYPRHGKTHLVTAWSKGDKETLSKSDRNALKQVKKDLDKAVRR